MFKIYQMLNQFDFDHLRNLAVGTVDFVSPSEIKVMLDTDAPQNTALNTGVPSLFPRINGFVLIPNEIGALVGLINWIAVEHSQYPKRKGFKDYDLIDLPFPMRKMSINPIGTLKQKGKIENKEYELERGIYTFPSIGDSVILPSEYQLKAIVENKDENAAVTIGKAVLAGNTDVKINPDKLFGRHLAILGNTGSGKSCSVAGLIRWSLLSAKKVIDEKNETLEEGLKKNLNARFIILDPNGEYSNAFDDIDKPVRKYKVKFESDKADENTYQLKIPAWMWNSHEWISFSQAAPGAQRPMLLDALLGLKSGRALNAPLLVRLNRFLIGYLRQIEVWISMPPVNMVWGDRMGCGRLLQNFNTEALAYAQEINASDIENTIGTENKGAIEQHLSTLAQSTIALHNSKSFPWNNTLGYNPFTEGELNIVRNNTNQILQRLPVRINDNNGVTPDTPTPFDISDLPNFISQIADNEGNNFAQFVAMLNLRLRFLIADERLRSVVNPDDNLSLSDWLKEYIGQNNAENGQIAVIDLSLIPSDIIHIIVAVLSRLIFEATQRYRRLNQKELPTVIVLEEAHTFIRDRSFDETNQSQLCREIFERIAREGRKFGLSMLLSSQRPSELSPTVLSQCNTFLLHRIVNDRDQDLVRKLVPDNIGGLLKELPILPTRKAILLGWAAPIPMLIELRELKEIHRPHSNDPKFWDVWIGKEERVIDWDTIANNWQGVNNIIAPNNPEPIADDPVDDLPF
jgi:DNA helicase HerA-like ATPase